MAAASANPALWRDADEVTPPMQWEAVEADGRWWWPSMTSSSIYETPITYVGAGPLPAKLDFDWQILSNGDLGFGLYAEFFYTLGDEPEEVIQLGDEVGAGSISIEVEDPNASFAWGVRGNSPIWGLYRAVVAVRGPHIPEPPPPCDTSYNCECGEDPGARTLADLRQELMVRLGYAAQLNNPPPGMVALLDSFLRDAQAQLYHRFTTFKTERFFTWPLEAGVRYYGLGENNDCCEGATLDPYKISWVGVEDASGVWYPLTHGIPPESYTMTDNWQGWPARYEVRECIEIFPAPSAGMRKLRIKGHFGLRPFTEDEHKTTINPDVLFLWALGTAKSHYGQPDAAVYFQQANDLIGRLVAGSHQTARYIPGRRSRRPLTPPKFLPISED